MKQHALFTFFFALIPGAGQMYQGYMKRGLSIMLLFAANIFLTTIIGIAGIFLPVIWAYSFFDTYRLRSELSQGSATADALLFFTNGTEDRVLASFLARRHMLVGWALILLGGWFLFDRFILALLRELLYELEFWVLLSALDYTPTLLVSLLLILLGVMLIRGRGLARPAQSDDNDYVEYLQSDEGTEEEDEDDE